MSAAPDETYGEIDVLINQANEQRARDPREGYRLAREALERLEALGADGDAHLLRLARVHTELGSFHKDQGDYRSSLVHARRALHLCRDGNLSEGAVDNLATVGWCHLRAANHPDALKSFLEALKQTRELGNEAKQARILGSVSAVYFSLKDYDRAIEGQRQALALYRASGPALGVAAALNNLACAQMEAGRLDEARRNVEEALEISRPCEKMPQMISNQLDTLGEIAYRTDHFDDALRLFEESLAGFREIGDSHGEQLALRNIGKTRLALGDTDGAIEELRASLLLAKKLGAQVDVAECHRQLHGLWKSLGDPERALEHHEQYHEVQQHMHGERVESRLGILEVEHEVETARHQAEIHRLKSVELARTVRELEETKATLEDRMEELHRLNRRVSELSIRDGLTGVHNRRYLDTLLEAAFQQARRHRRPLSVALLDLDDFKKVNDEFSHRVGDEVLRRTARVLTAELRGSDCAARYGGEEFALVMPDATHEACWAACERIRQQLEAYPWDALQPGLRVTISVGVAQLHREQQSEQLLQAADALLYEAKRKGKNRVLARERGVPHWRSA